jgi:pimeloyl-ACP methyl ester carboxylesterase
MVNLISRASPDFRAATRAPDPSTVRIRGPWTHRDVSANGIRIHIAESGNGPLVLLLHGFPEFWWAWHRQLESLRAAGYRAVAVDLRGYGDTDKPPRGYDGWTLSGDVAGLIRALGEQKAHLVGHAWGGMIAWTVAARAPRLVASVTAIAAPYPLALRAAVRRSVFRRADNQAAAISRLFRAQLPIMPERGLVADDAALVEKLLRRWGGPRWTVGPGFADVAARDRAAMRVPGVAHSALEYFRWAMRSQLRGDGRRFADELDRGITVPALQLHGAADPYLLESTALASRQWLAPDTDFRSLPDVGHFPHHEAAAAVSDLLLEFLAGNAS